MSRWLRRLVMLGEDLPMLGKTLAIETEVEISPVKLRDRPLLVVRLAESLPELAPLSPQMACLVRQQTVLQQEALKSPRGRGNTSFKRFQAIAELTELRKRSKHAVRKVVASMLALVRLLLSHASITLGLIARMQARLHTRDAHCSGCCLSPADLLSCQW